MIPGPADCYIQHPRSVALFRHDLHKLAESAASGIGQVNEHGAFFVALKAVYGGGKVAIAYALIAALINSFIESPALTPVPTMMAGIPVASGRVAVKARR